MLDRVHHLGPTGIPDLVADRAHRNPMDNSVEQNTRAERDKALARGTTAIAKDDTELFRQFADQEPFHR